MTESRQGHRPTWRALLTCLALVGVTAFVTRQVVSQEQSNGDKAQGGQTGEKEKAMMEAWMKSAAPGPNHEHLKAMVGTWNINGKFWMAPGTKPTESKSTAVIEPILGGRFILQKVKGEGFEGMPPFEGIGITGYNNTTGKFESVWMDNMSTLIMSSSGTINPAGNRFNFEGSYMCPMTQTQKRFRTGQNLIDKDTFSMEMWDQGQAGQDFQSMELRYQRAK